MHVVQLQYYDKFLNATGDSKESPQTPVIKIELKNVPQSVAKIQELVRKAF